MRSAPGLMLLLAACGTQPAPEPTAEPAKTVAAPASAVTWQVAGGSEGVALHALDPAQQPMLVIDCPLGSAELVVAVSSFEPIGSEDRLSIGFDDEPTALAADLEASGPGVRASGARDEALLRRIEAARTVSAIYGTQTIGPLTLPRAEAAEFVKGCRTPGETAD